jgi:restriction system protein
MNFLDAAYKVLKDSQKPLRYTEITARALAKGLLDTRGQTPESTMGSRLYVDVKKPNSRFRQVGQGLFALRRAEDGDIETRIDAINRRTEQSLMERLLSMPPDRFEVLVGELLRALGFEEDTIQITTRSNDGGIDVRGVLNAAGVTKINAAVQVKRWKRNIPAPVIQALRGALTVHEQGIVVTTSRFSSGAIAEAQAHGKTPISLIDGTRLVELLIEHAIGVKGEDHRVLSLDDDYWSVIDKPDVEETITAPNATKPPPSLAYPMMIRGKVDDRYHYAELIGATGRVSYAGVEYRSPSGAGMAATQWKSCNGWVFWRFQDAESGEWRVIDVLRNG